MVKFLRRVFVHFFNLDLNIAIYLGVNWLEIIFNLRFIKNITDLQLALDIFEFRLLRVNLSQLIVSIFNFHLLGLNVNLKLLTSFIEL